MAFAKKGAKKAQKKPVKKESGLPASFHRGQEKGHKPQRDSAGFIIPG